MRPVLAGPVPEDARLPDEGGQAPEGTDRLRHVLEAQREIAAAGDDYLIVLRVVCEQLLGLTAAGSASVLLLEGRELVARAWSGSMPSASGMRLDVASTFSGSVLRSGISALVDDFTQDPRTRDDAAEPGISSLLIVPLRHRGEALGQIHLASRAPSAFTAEDLEVVELLSVYVALALARASEADALARFATLFDKATVGIARWDADGRVVDVNTALERMLGYSTDELIGRRLDDVTHPDDLASTRALAEALAGELQETYLLEKRYLRKDGGEQWAQTTAVRDGVDADGRPTGISLIEDISERKHAELALRRNGRRLELIVETQGLIAETEAELNEVMRLIAERSQMITGGDGAVVSLIEGENLVVVASCGVCDGWEGKSRPLATSAAGHAIETRSSFLSADASRDRWLNQELVRQIGERSHVCVPLLHGDRPLGAVDVAKCSDGAFGDDDRRALELLCVVLSAAISRAAESEAKREQLDAFARFRAVYDSAPLGILILDLDGRPIDANPALQEILGYTAEELRELGHIDKLIHPDDVERTRLLREEMTESQRPGFQIERRYLCKDGSAIWTESSIAYVVDRFGEPAFVFSMLQDVTKRKSAEEQLRQAQKIEAIGQLTAGIAHDFNNLLMGVLGYTGFLRDQAESGSKSAEYLERIEQTAKRAAQLTQQLLAFGRQQALQPQTMDLNDHIAEAVSMLGRVIGEHIEIRVDLAPNLVPLRADPTQMHQVLLNLALNARDAMPDGGELRISTAGVEVGDPSVPGAVEPSAGGYVLLEVADTGCGMKAEVRDRIFDPFFTTKEVGAGSGLGLASVYGIVKQSGGEIRVESEIGAGTTFRIHLPAVEPTHASVQAELPRRA